jgi:hypothetical protein
MIPVFIALLVLAAVFGLLWLYSYKQDKLTPQERGKELQKTKVSTSMNRFAARREEKAALARAGTAAAIATEMATLNAPARLERADDVEQAAAENQILVSTKASANEMDAATYGLKKQSEIETQRERDLSEIRKSEHDRLTEIDLNVKLREAQETVRLAIIAKHLTDQQKIAITQDNIDGVIRQIDSIEKDEELSPANRQRMIDAREEVIKTLMEERRGREKRLLEAHNIGRIAEAPDAGIGSEAPLGTEPVGVPPKRGRGRPRKSDPE